MTEAVTRTGRDGTPWHLWLVGGLALLWNGYGAYDYLMTNLQGEAYLAAMGMTAAQVDYYAARPAWMTAAWALGVWGGVAGALLLLLRRGWAVWAFAVSLLGLVGSWIHTFMSGGVEVPGRCRPGHERRDNARLPVSDRLRPHRGDSQGSGLTAG